MQPSEVLALPMPPNDANATTIGDYLEALLLAVWDQGEGFSGKRPFGDSTSWKWDVSTALVQGGAVEVTLDSDGNIERFDGAARDAVIREAIDWAFHLEVPPSDHARHAPRRW